MRSIEQVRAALASTRSERDAARRKGKPTSHYEYDIVRLEAMIVELEGSVRT